MFRASEALNQIKDLNQSWAPDLTDAVAVYRDYSGKLRVDQSYQMTTGQGAALGGLFGGLIGALLAAPFTAGASAAVAAAALTTGSLSGVALGASLGAIDAEGWKEEFGISDVSNSPMRRKQDCTKLSFHASLIRIAVPGPREAPRAYGGPISDRSAFSCSAFWTTHLSSPRRPEAWTF